MKTVKSLIIFSLLAFFLNIGLSVSAFASDEAVAMQLANRAGNTGSHVDHVAIAEQYRRLAGEMQTKRDEQVEILRNKPNTSFLGRNGKYLKSRIINKIHEYEQVAQENLAKAAYHSAIAAEQASRNSAGQSGQMNKAKVWSNETGGL